MSDTVPDILSPLFHLILKLSPFSDEQTETSLVAALGFSHRSVACQA